LSKKILIIKKLLNEVNIEFFSMENPKINLLSESVFYFVQLFVINMGFRYSCGVYRCYCDVFQEVQIDYWHEKEIHDKNYEKINLRPFVELKLTTLKNFLKDCSCVTKSFGNTLELISFIHYIKHTVFNKKENSVITCKYLQNFLTRRTKNYYSSKDIKKCWDILDKYNLIENKTLI